MTRTHILVYGSKFLILTGTQILTFRLIKDSFASPIQVHVSTHNGRSGCGSEVLREVAYLVDPIYGGCNPVIPEISVVAVGEALQKREKWISKSKNPALWEEAHERNAKRALSLMIELEGLWVKFGQYLSTRADVVPDAYIRVLKQLQDSLSPRPLQEFRQTIHKELGKRITDIFANFVEAPLVTASIAQVHRATLLDGREVVIKVQHDGIKAVILEPKCDLNPLIDEWCRETLKELDFNLEAENTRTVSRNLGYSDDNKGLGNVNVFIPEVVQSTERVLIFEYMDGIRLNDSASLEAYGIDKQKIVEEITRAYAHQIYVDGFFNGDPHPGNFLISKEPPHRPILLDFGLTKKLPNTMKLALAKMFLAAAEDLNSEMTIGIAWHDGGLYFLTEDASSRICDRTSLLSSCFSNSETDYMLWHFRLGHPSFHYMKYLFPHLFHNINVFKLKWDVCVQAKQPRVSFKPQPYKPSKPFILFHSDVWGLSDYDHY
ncbi:aarF domain-containing protein kinase 1-like [Benincasa hispida]|uniref:aarF domain-containing protein kinase 1-like n=1 Tax=Benincasa hispida TaxID=102211 RepID=UPI0018FF7493|nr:aarF domain-containing protein kinase 1-like [Benincasa hispida]